MAASFKSRLLRIQAPHYVAGCVWIRVSGVWIVDKERCAPILKWMTQLPIGGALTRVATWLYEHRKTHRYKWMKFNIMNTWQSMENAPRDGTKIIAEIPGYGTENIIFWDIGFVDFDGNDCGAWIHEDEINYPNDWSDGVCWKVNEDGKASTSPIRWRPILKE